jgi:very-short-patch-repair endonuclease
MRADLVIASWAGDRLGIASRDELLAQGLTADQIDYRVWDRTLLTIHDGVYRHAAAPRSWMADLRAATLATERELGLVAGASSMRLFGIRGVWESLPEILVAGRHLPDLRGVRIRRIDQIDALDIDHRFGIPVVSMPLALLLLGATHSERKVETAIHDAVHLGLTSRAELEAVLDRYAARGRRGVTKFRAGLEALPSDGTATERNLEVDMLRLLRVNGLPRPKVQLPVIDADGIRRRLDLAYPEAKLDIETDGDRWHKIRGDRRSDRRRDDALEAVGWEVQRYDSDDIHVWSGLTVRRIRRSLSARLEIVQSARQRTGSSTYSA